jgi:hypothetical protein
MPSVPIKPRIWKTRERMRKVNQPQRAQNSHRDQAVGPPLSVKEPADLQAAPAIRR